jgi:A/G-specific adenine glycosylase
MKTALHLHEFKNLIWSYYAAHGRLFDWRNVADPYRVFISEVMLQQTQTYRVAHKYVQFISAFNSFDALASASLKDVLYHWQGLGYNRRGMYLHKAAQIVVQDYAGKLPSDPALLVMLPGIGKATAASIAAFAFNVPTIFIETNIRTVFIHCFFADKQDIDDKDILPLVQATLDTENPREWYYALMDYGVMLKKTLPNPSRKSKHHQKQSKFEGSDRQVRGKIIKLLTQVSEPLSLEGLIKAVDDNAQRTQRILQQLSDEKFIAFHSHDLVAILDR